VIEFSHFKYVLRVYNSLLVEIVERQ
jgi:hypothetical protein